MELESIAVPDYSVELNRIVKALQSLGNGNANDGGMGAIENLSIQVGRVADAISEVAEAIRWGKD